MKSGRRFCFKVMVQVLISLLSSSSFSSLLLSSSPPLSSSSFSKSFHFPFLLASFLKKSLDFFNSSFQIFSYSLVTTSFQILILLLVIPNSFCKSFSAKLFILYFILRFLTPSSINPLGIREWLAMLVLVLSQTSW